MCVHTKVMYVNCMKIYYTTSVMCSTRNKIINFQLSGKNEWLMLEPERQRHSKEGETPKAVVARETDNILQEAARAVRETNIRMEHPVTRAREDRDLTMRDDSKVQGTQSLEASIHINTP